MSDSITTSKLRNRWAGAMPHDTYIWLFIGGLIVYCLAVFFGSYYGVRGSDEFWYLADIASLVEGRGAHSNFVFAYTFITDTYAGPRPFVHNILYPYLSALPGHIFGPFAGAIIANAISHIFASLVIIVLITRLLHDQLLAVLVALMYLFFPLNYWLSINVLAESSLVPFVVVLAVVMLCTSWHGWQWFAAAIVIGIMIFARSSMLLFAVMLPIAFLTTNRGDVRTRALLSFGLLITILSFAWFWGHFFEPNVPCSLIERINVRVPGKTSGMYCLFKLPDQAIMFPEWPGKIIHNLFGQFNFSNIYALLFYWPVNLLVIIGAIVLVKTKVDKVRILGWLCMSLALVHLGTLVIMTNQFRYLVLLVPVSFVLLAVYVSDHARSFFNRHRFTLCIVFISASLIVDFRLALRARHDAIDSNLQMTQLTAYVGKNIDADENVFLEAKEDRYGPSLAIRIGTNLTPRSVLMVPASYEMEQYDILLTRFSPSVFILRRDSDLYRKLPNVGKNRISNLPGAFSEYSLFRID